MNDLLPFAKQMLRDYGEFHPFGGTMKSDGEIVHVGATSGEDISAPSALVEILTEGFRSKAREKAIKAAAIVLNVRVLPPGRVEKCDAIEVRIDHHDGYSAHVFFPYRSTDDLGMVFEVPFAARGNPFVFG